MRIALKVVLMMSLMIPLFSHAADDAIEEHEQGVLALQESQKNPRKIVEAARHFTKAAELYEKNGNESGAVEMNSYLYWCKKKMTLADIESFLKGGEVVVANRLKAVEERKIEKSDAQAWYDRAETFAKAKPAEHYLIAARFFEVADRFVGTEVSLKAQRKSLEEMQIAQVAPTPRKAEPAPAPIPNIIASGAPKLAIPTGTPLKDAEKAIKDIFKDDYAKRSPEDRKALGLKLLQQGIETKDDATVRYVLLRDAGAAAAQIGDIETTLKTIEELTKLYDVDVAALKLDALGKVATTLSKPDQAKALARNYLSAGNDAAALGNYDAAVKLLTFGDTAARKGADMPLATQITARLKDLRTIQTDSSKFKTAQQMLKDKPDDPECNATVGKFLCFTKGEWEAGLPHLSKCKEAALKIIVDQELASPADAKDQAALGDLWWNYSDKMSGFTKGIVQAHAVVWYGKALSGMTGINKTKLEKRIIDVAAVSIATKKVTIRDNLLLLFKDSKSVMKLEGIAFKNDALTAWIHDDDEEIKKGFTALGHPNASLTLTLDAYPCRTLVIEAGTISSSGGDEVEVRVGDKVLFSKTGLQRSHFQRLVVNLEGISTEQPIVFSFTAPGCCYNAFFIKSLHFDFPGQ